MNEMNLMEALGSIPLDLINCGFERSAEPAGLISGTASVQPAAAFGDPLPQIPDEKAASGTVSMRRMKYLPAAAVAACLLFAVGFVLLFLQAGNPAQSDESSGYFLAEESVPETLPVTSSPGSTQTTQSLTTAGTSLKKTTQTTALPVIAETAADIPAETEPQTDAAPAETSTEITTFTTEAAATETETTTDSDIIPIDIPEGGVYVMHRRLADDPLPKEVRIAAAPEAVFIIDADDAGESVSVRYGSETELLCRGVYISQAIFADISGDGIPELCLTAYTAAHDVMYTAVYETTERKQYTIGETGDLSQGGWEMFEVGVDGKGLAGIRRTYYPPEERNTVHENSKAYGTFRILDGILYFIEDRTGTQYH